MKHFISIILTLLVGGCIGAGLMYHYGECSGKRTFFKQHTHVPVMDNVIMARARTSYQSR